jgi:amino acid transporter
MIPLALGNIFVTGIVVLALQHSPVNGEVVLSVIGAVTIAFTLFLLFRGARPAAKVMHASRVSEA